MWSTNIVLPFSSRANFPQTPCSSGFSDFSYFPVLSITSIIHCLCTNSGMPRPKITILNDAVSFLLKTLHAQVPKDTDDKALLGTRMGSYSNNTKEEYSGCFSTISPLLSEVGLVRQLKPKKNELKPAGVTVDYEVKLHQTTRHL